MAKLPLLEVPIVDYGADEAAMVAYRRAGEERAASLGNRGPLRFTADGKLDPDILAKYVKHGFYIFEGVLGRRLLARRLRAAAAAASRPPGQCAARRRGPRIADRENQIDGAVGAVRWSETIGVARSPPKEVEIMRYVLLVNRIEDATLEPGTSGSRERSSAIAAPTPP